VRAYQKAENLPVSGQVDSRTAAGLGVRPESTWDISQSAERLGRSSDVVSGAFIGGKPSAGIKRAKGRQGKTARKEVSGATMIGDNRGSGGNKQQAEHEEDDQ
jgi:hypothetical protein